MLPTQDLTYINIIKKQRNFKCKNSNYRPQDLTYVKIKNTQNFFQKFELPTTRQCRFNLPLDLDLSLHETTNLLI